MKTTFQLPATLANPVTYNLNSVLIDGLVTTGKTIGLKQAKEKIVFTKLNAQRSKDADKPFEILPDLRKALKRIPEKWDWILITESNYNADAQLVLSISEIAAASTNIELTILLRDENPELVDLYLTNGSRALPKLICLEADTFETLFTWGPQPICLQEKVHAMKAENPYTTKNELHKYLAPWYAQDNGAALQNDILHLVKRAIYRTCPAY